MNLLLLQYLKDLKERNELDAILPDLLNEMGLRVFSRPSVGGRQYGVDVGAVGRLGDDKHERVYLFTVKPGDLTREAWQGGPQSVSASLDEIIQVYRPTHLPTELRGKPVVIVVCIGGTVRQEVALNLASYEKRNTRAKIKFQTWNGDRLAQLIETHLFSEHLVTGGLLVHLRKSIALLEEPDAATRHFVSLLNALAKSTKARRGDVESALRTMALSVSILHVWSRDEKHYEAVLRASQLALLRGWEMVTRLKVKKPASIPGAFGFLVAMLLRVYNDYTSTILSSANVYLGLSLASQSDRSADCCLALFKLIGRLALLGLWQKSLPVILGERVDAVPAWHGLCVLIETIIKNNPRLKTPLLDDHVTAVGLVTLLLSSRQESRPFLKGYLHEMAASSIYGMRGLGPYPCTLRNYEELIDHPKSRDKAYIQRCTEASVLYPAIALWSSLLGDDAVYVLLANAKKDLLAHCTFQIWSPGTDTEAHLCLNDQQHGTAFMGITMQSDATDFAREIWAECDAASSFSQLSCIILGWNPVLLTACHAYSLPIPFHFFRSMNADPTASA
jgi:hypothetical protein